MAEQVRDFSELKSTLIKAPQKAEERGRGDRDRASSTSRAAPMPPASARTPSPASGSSPAPAASTVNGSEENNLFRPPGAAHDPAPAAWSPPRATGSSTSCARCIGGGFVRSGRRGAPRHLQGADRLRAQSAPGAEAGRVPDPRSARRRAQEVRPSQGPPQLPVLEALICMVRGAAVAVLLTMTRASGFTYTFVILRCERSEPQGRTVEL